MMEYLKYFLFVFILTILMISPVGAADKSSFLLPFTQLLDKNVDQDGFVDYRGLKAEPADLDDFIKILSSLEHKIYESFSDQEKVAFWINVYNALILKIIVDHYPIQPSFVKSLRFPKNSIRQIPGVWDKITISVLGEDRSLDFIEHEILRKEFDEPRIHMALVCAARGCPSLRQEPFTGEKVETQLDEQARIFLSNPQKFFIDEKKQVVYVSSIFKWFGKDFLNQYSPESGFEGHSRQLKAVLHFISLFIPEKQSDFLKQSEYRVKYLKYDWTLNEWTLK